jgi:hypothetical protein
MKFPNTLCQRQRAMLAALVLLATLAPQAVTARNSSWFNRQECESYIGWLQEDPSWDKNTSDIFAMDRLSGRLYDGPGNMTLTLRGCEQFCGSHTFYWDAGPRVMTWIVPVLLLLSNVELSPIDKKRFMTIIHALGDPIDSFWSLIHKIYMWDRLYQIGLQKSPKTLVQGLDERMSLWFKLRNALIKFLVLTGMTRAHAREPRGGRRREQEALKPDGGGDGDREGGGGESTTDAIAAAAAADDDNEQPLTREFRAKIIATVLSGFEEISGSKVESDLHYHMITYKLGRLGESDEDSAKFEEWRKCARLLADARTNEYLRTVLAIAVYFLNLIAAFVPALGGDQSSPPGGRIGSAVFISWLVPLALLSNRIGAFTSRRACLHIMKEFVLATSEDPRVLKIRVERPRAMSNVSPTQAVAPDRFPVSGSGDVDLGERRGDDKDEFAGMSAGPDDAVHGMRTPSPRKMSKQRQRSSVHFAEDVDHRPQHGRSSSSYSLSPYAHDYAEDKDPFHHSDTSYRGSTGSDIGLLRHQHSPSGSTASDLGLRNEMYAERSSTSTSTSHYHNPADGQYEMVDFKGKEPLRIDTQQTQSHQQQQQQQQQYQPPRPPPPHFHRTPETMTQVSLVRFLSWDDYFASLQWLGAIYTYRPWKVQYRHVDHRTHAKRTNTVMALAGLFPVFVSATGASFILWYAVPRGFSCRSVWIVAIFVLWLLSALVTTVVYRLNDRKRWHREERRRRGPVDFSSAASLLGIEDATRKKKTPALKRSDPEHKLWTLILAKDAFIATTCVAIIFLSTAGVFNNCYCWSAYMTWHDEAVVPLNSDEEYKANAVNIYSGVVVSVVGAQVVFFLAVTGYYWQGLSIARWHEEDKREEWAHESAARVQWTRNSELLFWYYMEDLEDQERSRASEENRVRLTRRESAFESALRRSSTWVSLRSSRGNSR